MTTLNNALTTVGDTYVDARSVATTAKHDYDALRLSAVIAREASIAMSDPDLTGLHSVYGVTYRRCDCGDITLTSMWGRYDESEYDDVHDTYYPAHGPVERVRHIATHVRDIDDVILDWFTADSEVSDHEHPVLRLDRAIETLAKHGVDPSTINIATIID